MQISIEKQSKLKIQMLTSNDNYAYDFEFGKSSIKGLRMAKKVGIPNIFYTIIRVYFIREIKFFSVRT